MCVQESNIDVRSDDFKGLMSELRDHRVALYRGTLEDGKCKVAFLVKKGSFRLEGHLKVGPVSRSLCGTWHGGGDASVKLACLDCPVGESAANAALPSRMVQSALEWGESHGAVPCLVAGDINKVLYNLEVVSKIAVSN